jgi:cytochrome c oxidase subunit II
LVESKAEPVRLGRGFWIVTGIYTILAIASIVFWYMAPVYQWLNLPVAIETASKVDELSTFMFATGSALYIYVLGYIVYFAIAFRAKKSDPPDAIGVQIHDNHALELWWTVIPVVFVVLLSIVSVKIWYQIMVEPENGIVVESIGHQFYWSFRYPQVNGEVTGEMHLPVGVPVTLNLTSADVIHSFWVPAMRLKNDMVPGLVTTIRFKPTLVGRFPIVCTQFCGTAHSTMNSMVDSTKQWVVIEDQKSYDAWYNGWKVKNAHVSDALPVASSGTIDLTTGKADAGKTLFATKCSACHALAPFSKTIVGPGLLGVLHDPSHPNLVDGDPATPENAAKILQNGFTGPIGQMPNATTNGLSNQDIADLVAYLNTLK